MSPWGLASNRSITAGVVYYISGEHGKRGKSPRSACRRRSAVHPVRCKPEFPISSGGKTPFGMRNDAFDRYPATDYGQMLENVPDLVKDMLTDAAMWYYGSRWREAVGMAPAAVEEALQQLGYDGRLEKIIDDAKADGRLKDHEYMLAHSSRLAGNEALHRENSLDPALVPAALSAAVVVVNHLFR